MTDILAELSKLPPPDPNSPPVDLLKNGTIEEQRQIWALTQATAQALKDRAPIAANVQKLSAQAAAKISSIQALKARADAQAQASAMLKDLTNTLGPAAQAMSVLNAQNKARQATVAKLRVQALIAAQTYAAEQKQAPQRVVVKTGLSDRPWRGRRRGALSDNFSQASAQYAQWLRAGKPFVPVRADLSPACTPGTDGTPGCAIDEREPGFIYLTRVTDWGGKPPKGWVVNPANPLASMWEWNASASGRQNLEAPWVGTIAEEVPEPTGPGNDALKLARLTGDYSYFLAKTPTIDFKSMTPRETEMYNRSRGKVTRIAHQAEEAATIQEALYALYVVPFLGLVTGTVGAGVAAGVGTALSTTIAAGVASFAISVGVSSLAPGSDLAFTPREIVHQMDKQVFRRIYKPVIKALGQTINFLDTYVPGWATLLDFLAPMFPVIPLLTLALAEAAQLAGEAVVTIFNIGVAASGLVPGASIPVKLVALVIDEATDAAVSTITTGAVQLAKLQGIMPSDMFGYQATLYKAIATFVTTEGQWYDRVLATSKEIVSGYARVVQLAVLVTGQIEADIVLQGLIESLNAISIGLTVLAVSVQLGQVYVNADRIKDASKKALKAAQAEAAQVDSEIAFLNTQIAKIQAQRQALADARHQRLQTEVTAYVAAEQEAQKGIFQNTVDSLSASLGVSPNTLAASAAVSFAVLGIIAAFGDD